MAGRVEGELVPQDSDELTRPLQSVDEHGRVPQYETEIRAERTLAEQAVARVNGKHWGGSKKGRRIWVTDEQARTIRRLKSEGEKVAAIARAVGLSRPTVYRITAEEQ